MDKLQSLRRVVANMNGGPTPTGHNPDMLGPYELLKATLANGWQETIGLKRAGMEALNALCEQWMLNPVVARGYTFDELTDWAFHKSLNVFYLRRTEPVRQVDLEALEAELTKRLTDGVRERRLYIPCAIIHAQAPEFTIGPVRFQTLDAFLSEEDGQGLFGFDHLEAAMRTGGASWMASLVLKGHPSTRLWEIGEVAVDLALAGLQLLLPLASCARMTRLFGRITAGRAIYLSGEGDDGTVEFRTLNPGMALSGAVFSQHLGAGAAIVDSVGRRLAAFLEGDGGTPTLERAWSDAAYWFHEGLAEPRDAVAVTKLVTAIEVLLRAEGTRKGASRLLTAVEVFYGRRRDELVQPDSTVTVEAFVNRFVRERSMILHGTASTLQTTLGTSRNNLENLVAGLLRNYAVRLDAFQASDACADDVAALLKWVEVRAE